MLRRLISVAFLASLVMLAAPTTRVLACSCAQVTQAEALRHADAAFVGVVAAIDDPGVGPPVIGGDVLRYTFAVESELKGELASTIGLFSSRSGASCGQEFALAQRWRVFAYVDETGRLQSGLCSGNELLAEGAPIPQQAPSSIMPPVTVLLALGVILVLGGISAWAFLRRPGAVS